MYDKKTLWIITGLIALTIILFFVAVSHKAGASFTPKPTITPTPTISHCKEWKWEEDCITPTPTKKPKPTPTPTEPCLQIGDEDVQVPCPSPTVTPKPTSTPTPTASPSPTPSVTSPNAISGGSSGDNGSNNPPAIAQCKNDSFVGPVLVSFTDKGQGTVNFAWTEITGSIDKYSIIYGYSPDALVFGQDNIPGNVWNWDIHNLNPGSHVWAKVSAWKNNCAVESNLFDPVVR